MIEPLVVIVHRDREHLLGVALADHVVVEDFADFLRGRDAVARLHQRGLVLLADDIHAELDALVANEDGRTGDELAHLVLALAAERAVERVLGVATADLAHSISPSTACRLGRLAALQQSITGGLLRVRSTNVTLLRAFGPFPAKSLLANHGSVGIIKNLLMMKIQAHGDFLAFSQQRQGATPKPSAAGPEPIRRPWKRPRGACRSLCRPRPTPPPSLR